MSRMMRRCSVLAMAVFVLFPLMVLAQVAGPIDVGKYTAPIRVSCVGDSITAGVGAGPGGGWPNQLKAMMGEKWDIRNFGVGGTTLMNSGDIPYQKQRAFQAAKDFKPDVVVIMLGANDTKPRNWQHFARDYEADYRDLVKKFQELPSKPRVFVCRPSYISQGGNWGINERNTLKEIEVVDKLAASMQLGLIDIHAALKGKDNLIPDHVHPNRQGQTEIAKAVRNALTGKVPHAAKYSD